MGLFGNLSPDQLALLSAGGAMATPPTRIPVPFGYSLAQGLAALPQGQAQSQQLQSGSMANQLQHLNLQRQQAMQPAILNSLKSNGGIFGGVPGGGAGSVSPIFGQALQAAMMSGDMGKVSAVLQAAAEHDPANAGAIARATVKTPQGTIGEGTGQPNLATQVFGDNQGNDLPNVVSSKLPLAADGKPVLPNQTNLFSSDPTGMPKYKTENTETGVNETRIIQAADDKANTAFTSNAQSLQQEQYRLQQLADVYKQYQAGTLTAGNLDTANKLIQLGIIRNPNEIDTVAHLQNALQNHALQIIQQIKDTNANLGGAPTRTFGSEIANLQEKGEDPKVQPAALFDTITQAKGIVDHHLDMINGWNAIGGLGNRAANGYTLRPDDYARQFIQNHDINDYKTAAQQQIGSFKGMNNNGVPQVKKWTRDVQGNLVQQ